MTISFKNVYGQIKFNKEYLELLYSLMQEREPYQSISHKELPTFDEHCVFVESRPYDSWWVICIDDTPVGAVYAVKDLFAKREYIYIGLFVLKQYKRMGLGHAALDWIKYLYPCKDIYANIARHNYDSQDFFESQGFKEISYTYKLNQG